MHEYFQANRLSQSELKRYLKHPKYIKEKESDDLYENEDHHFTKGSLLDLIVTDKNAEEIIEKTYFINQVSDISDTLKAIIRKVYFLSNMDCYPEGNSHSLSEIDAENIQHACNNELYYMNRYKEGEDPTNDWRVKKILDDKNCQDYLDTLLKSRNKIIINEEDLQKSHSMSSALFNDKYTAPYFELETIYQKPLYQNILALPAKGLLDMIFIDRKKKKLYITDLKSSGRSLAYFFQSIWKFRYDIQGSWYKELLIVSGEYEGYTIEFNIFATSFFEPNNVEIFHFPNEVLDFAKHGNKEKHRIGWLDLIDRYDYHQNNGFDYSLDYFKNGGKHIVE